MRVASLIIPLTLFNAALAVLRRDEQGLITSAAGVNAAPKRYILEFAEGVDHAEAVKEISARPGTKILKTFNSTDIFSGVSVESLAENIDSFNAIGTVSRAWPAKRIHLEEILDQSFSDAATAANYSIHDMTGVDKLHAAGITGKGAIVAVVDTGIYYPHPDIGGGFGPGFKVAGGYDYVGDGLWPDSGETEPDNDPIDTRGHGTHVAGILAGKGPWFTGVAPDATLLSYKVFSNAASTDEDTLIEAFLDAYNAGADIITASIGGPSGWSENAWASVADRLVDAGVVVTISAGNNGDVGPFFASSGSSGQNVLAVASLEPSNIVSMAFEASLTLNDGLTNVTRMAYRAPFGAFPGTIKDWPVILVDPCSPLPDDTPSLKNALPLFAEGWCSSFTAEANLGAFDARYILTYTSSNASGDPYLAEWTLRRGILQTAAAEALVAAIEAGASINATFPTATEFVGVPNSHPRWPSVFTSFGGTYDLSLKPDIAAPGTNIFSLYPGNAYAVMSGTSMACPYVAGVAALYIGQHGGRFVHGAGFAKQLAARILSSGNAVPWGSEAGNGTYASVAQVGNGLVNATKVLDYKTELSFSKFALNDTHYFSRYHSVEVTNNAAETVVYTFDLKPSGAFEAYWPKAEDAYMAPRMRYQYEVGNKPLQVIPNIKWPSGKFEVKPGGMKKAEFIFEIPDGINAANLPVYSGQILVKGSNGEELSVPYFGVGSNVRRELDGVFFDSYNYPRSYSTPSQVSLGSKSWFTFNLSLASQDFPKLQAAFKYGTRELRWDIFEESWKERKWVYPPVVGQNGYLGSATSFALSGQKSTFDPATDDESNLVAFPDVDLYRQGLFEYWWLGRFANGSHITPGKYCMRIAARLPFADPTHSDNWDVWGTPMIEVVTTPKS